VHERIHTGDKPYKCAFCDYRSAQVGNTRIHERRHTGVKPYPCPLCPFAAVTSSATYAHMKSMHPGATDEVKPALPAARGRRASTGGALPQAVAAPPSAPVGHQAAGPGAPGQGQVPQASTGSAATLVASAAAAGPGPCAATTSGPPSEHRESFLLAGTACPPPVGHHDVVSEVHQVAVSLPALALQHPGPGQPHHEPAGSVGASGTSESAVFLSSSGSPATAGAITHWHQAPLAPAGQPQAQAACSFDPDSESGQLLGLDVPVVHVAAMPVDPAHYFHSESEQHPHLPVAES
jgi:KRAB domain-containing zinc finger protein